MIASISTPCGGDAVSTTPELWAKTLDTNLTGGFYVAKAAMPELRRNRGAIVLTASVQGMAAQKGALAYVVPPAITATAILALLVAVHALIGTPEIARTIAVPWSVSTFYAVVYAATLARGQAKAPK